MLIYISANILKNRLVSALEGLRILLDSRLLKRMLDIASS